MATKKDRRLGKHGYEMDDDELEFLKAVDRFRLEVRQCPTVTDYLQIAKSLGYRKDGNEPAKPNEYATRPVKRGKSGRQHLQHLQHKRLRPAGVCNTE